MLGIWPSRMPPWGGARVPPVGEAVADAVADTTEASTEEAVVVAMLVGG